MIHDTDKAGGWSDLGHTGDLVVSFQGENIVFVHNED